MNILKRPCRFSFNRRSFPIKTTIIFLISVSSCLFANNDKDSLLESGVLSLKAGYYPYQSWSALSGEGFVLTISHNDFTRFLNWGYSFSLNKSIKEYNGAHAQMFGGIGIVHKTEVFNRTTFLRLSTGLSILNYPVFTNLLEVDFILSFYGLPLNLSLSTGIMNFRALMPIAISIGFTI